MKWALEHDREPEVPGEIHSRLHRLPDRGHQRGGLHLSLLACLLPSAHRRRGQQAGLSACAQRGAQRPVGRSRWSSAFATSWAGRVGAAPSLHGYRVRLLVPFPRLLAHHESTRFHGDMLFRGLGGIRTAYFALLISHIGLSAVALPMILVTFFLSPHREVSGPPQARPLHVSDLALCVSVTGVVALLDACRLSLARMSLRSAPLAAMKSLRILPLLLACLSAPAFALNPVRAGARSVQGPLGVARQPAAA